LVRPEDAERSDEPERFLPLPDCGREFQLSLGRRFLSAPLGASAEEITRLGDLRLEVKSLNLESSWNQTRVEAVTEALLTWAAAHGMSEELVVEPPRPPGNLLRQPRREASTSQASQDSTALRKRLLEIVGEMSTPELLELRIPARFL